jgi:hypothetical protein
MAKKTNLKLKIPKLRQQSTAPIDAVRNPNFPAAMAQQNYANSLAEQRARMGMERGGAPLTQSEIDKKYVDDGRGGRVLNAEDAAKLKLQFDALRANNERMGGSRINDIDYIEGGPRYAPINQGPDLPSLMPIGKFSPDQMQNLSPERRRALEERLSGQYQNPANRGMGEKMIAPIPQAPQGAQAAMADYNKMLQQGTQRSQEMSQAAQNLTGMGGPQRSFSQVAGGVRRMNRTPRQPRNNSLAPSNQKLI